SARVVGVPRGRAGQQYQRVLRCLRRQARRQALSRAGRSGHDLVTCDLVVIGGGAAGEKAAVAAAFFGNRVALIEDLAEGPGGAVVHTGTLPSKTLRESALLLEDSRNRELFESARQRFLAETRSAADLTRRLAAVEATQTNQIRANLAR